MRPRLLRLISVTAAVKWWDAHQVALYVAAIGVGIAVGLIWPAAAPVLSSTTSPLLAMLLFATFVGIPLIQVGRAFRDVRFLGTVLAVNFVLVPLVAFGLSRFVTDDQGLLVGVLLVLLTPCVDYVIVFTGLAGGARTRLLAATPLLMLLQIALLPAYLWLFAGGDVVTRVELEPFIEAFLILIVIPLAAAAFVQGIARRGVESPDAGDLPDDVLSVNDHRATRHGLDTRVVDVDLVLRPLREVAARVLADARATLVGDGLEAPLDAVESLLAREAEPDHQRRTVAAGGIRALLADLADRTADLDG